LVNVAAGIQYPKSDLSVEKVNMKLAILLVGLFAITLISQGQVSKQSFGKTGAGEPVEIYTLKSGSVEVRIMTYGGIVVSLKTPDKRGKVDDVVLGYDTVDGYLPGNKAYFGAIIGRYANRIAKGKFVLDGVSHQLPTNDGPNSLHGGTQGFDKVVWKAKEIASGVELSHVSPDGNMGYPGTVNATVRYTLKGSTLRIEYSATTDKDTVINLTNHSYFNLHGQGNGTILDHQLKLNASKYTPVDQTLIPTGQIAPVEGTPFDFRKITTIGSRIDAKDEQIVRAKGYDDNWVLDNGGKFAEAAELYDPSNGRFLQVWTDQPGIQFYSGNFLDGTIKGKNGNVYQYRSGMCLETQHFPDSPNRPNFPSAELKPGQRYHTVTEFRFSTR
jgi:aldose 1-epimerase